MIVLAHDARQRAFADDSQPMPDFPLRGVANRNWSPRELKRRGIDADTANTAAELADGSLGVALRWIEDDMLSVPRRISSNRSTWRLRAKETNLADLLRKQADAYAQKVLARDELASKDSATRNGLGMYLGIAARRIRGRLARAEPFRTSLFRPLTRLPGRRNILTQT